MWDSNMINHVSTLRLALFSQVIPSGDIFTVTAKVIAHLCPHCSFSNQVDEDNYQLTVAMFTMECRKLYDLIPNC